MPQGLFPITQRDITVTRSVVRDTVRSLLEKVGMPKDTELIFNEKQGAVRIKGGTFERCGRDITTDHNNIAFIEYTENYLPSGFNRDDIIHLNHLHLFKDASVGVYALPKYATVKLEMTVRLRTKNLTDLNMVINNMKISDTNRNMLHKHNIRYDYGIPPIIDQLICRVHELKSGGNEDLIALKDYLTEHFKDGVKTRSNQTGTQSELICEEVQKDRVGRSVEEQPYNATEIGEGLYELPLTYELHYQQPIGVAIQVPIIINNQFVGMDVVNVLDNTNVNVSDDKEGWSPKDYLQMKGADMSRYAKHDGGTRMYDFDDWFPQLPLDGTTTLCIAPIIVNTENPNVVCNLNDLSDDLLPADIKKFLTDNIALEGKAPRSLIHLEVFETGEIETSLDFTLSEDLTITTLATLDPTRRVHVRVSLFNDWTLCPYPIFKDILRAPESCIALAKRLDSQVELYESGSKVIRTKKDKLVVHNGVITMESMREWLLTLPTVNLAFKRAPGGFMRTVNINNVKVGR